MKERSKAIRAIRELGGKPQDVNYLREEYNAMVEPQKPSGNVHNTATSLQKGIYAALKTIEHASDLHGYLSKTLIVKRKAGLKPFAYRPDLYDGPDHSLRNITWDISPPAP